MAFCKNHADHQKNYAKAKKFDGAERIGSTIKEKSKKWVNYYDKHKQEMERIRNEK